MISVSEAKSMFRGILNDYDLSEVVINEGASYTQSGETVRRWINIQVPEKGNSEAIKYLQVQGCVKKRRVSANRSYGLYRNYEPHKFFIHLEFDCSVKEEG